MRKKSKIKKLATTTTKILHPLVSLINLRLKHTNMIKPPDNILFFCGLPSAEGMIKGRLFLANHYGLHVNSKVCGLLIQG